MKELPKVFRNEINRNIDNNKKVYYSQNEISGQSPRQESSKNVQQKINEIFSSPNYVYKANVEIVLKDKTLSKKIIGRNKNYIITMDNELIPITDIMDIKSVKK